MLNKSIKSKGGLRPHLDQTRDQHNGFGYDDFEKMARAGVNPSNLCKVFSVSRWTAYKWLELWKVEK